MATCSGSSDKTAALLATEEDIREGRTIDADEARKRFGTWDE
jgi:hypothetical protein